MDMAAGLQMKVHVHGVTWEVACELSGALA